MNGREEKRREEKRREKKRKEKKRKRREEKRRDLNRLVVFWSNTVGLKIYILIVRKLTLTQI